MKKSDIKTLRIVPTIIFLSLVCYNLIQIYFVDPVACECGAVYSDYFLANEVLNVGYIYFMFLVAKTFKLCYYNIVAISGLMFMTLLNIIAIKTHFDYTMYNSTVTQTVVISLLLLTLYFLIRKK